MAVTTKWYIKGLQHVAQNDVKWDDNSTTTIKCLLLTSSYTPNQDTHEFRSSLSGEVANGSGYATNGIALTTRSIGEDAATNETRFITTTNPSWTTASFTTRYAVIYKDTGTAGTSILLGYVDFGADQTVVAGTFAITWDTTGALKITAA